MLGYRQNEGFNLPVSSALHHDQFSTNRVKAAFMHSNFVFNYRERVSEITALNTV
jgi:hypothetical protein